MEGVAIVAIVALLLALPWPFWRLAMSAPVRHRRRDQVALFAALGGYSLSCLIVVVVWPALVPLFAGVISLATLALELGLRFGLERRGGVPPGRIRLHPLDLFEDLNHLHRQADTHGPIFKMGATFPVPTFKPIICVVGNDLGRKLLR